MAFFIQQHCSSLTPPLASGAIHSLAHHDPSGHFDLQQCQPETVRDASDSNDNPLRHNIPNPYGTSPPKNITHFDCTSTPGVQDTHLRHSTRVMFSTRDGADHLLTENHHTNHHKYAEHIGNCGSPSPTISPCKVPWTAKTALPGACAHPI